MKTYFSIFGMILMIVVTQGAASGRTYYIDFEAGSDSNDGTASVAAWKRHPFMAGWGGGSKYVHSPGDRFIFKGGVVWTADAFPLTIPVGGVDGNPDYYGIDKAWHNGDAWSRPVFDGEGKASEMIAISTGSHIVLDGIEGRDLVFNSAWGVGIITIYGTPRHITIRNCFLHKWTVNDSIHNDDAHGGVIVNTRNIPVGIVIDECTISNSEYSAVKNNGTAVLNVRTVRNSTIHDVTTAILFAGEVYNNHIYNINHPNPSFDPNHHTNLMYVAAQSSISPFQYVYNNVIHDIASGTGIYMEPCWGDTSHGYVTQFVYNNIVFNAYNGGGGIVSVDPESGAGPCGKVYVYQNTLQMPDESQIGMVRSLANHNGVNQIGTLVTRNNHYIGPHGEWDVGLARHWSSRNNLQMSNSEATAAGYHAGNCFRPTTGTSATVDKARAVRCTACPGIDKDISGVVARGYGAGWDIGAHEWSGTGGTSARGAAHQGFPGQSCKPQGMH